MDDLIDLAGTLIALWLIYLAIRNTHDKEHMR
jgi:hypothetical protein